MTATIVWKRWKRKLIVIMEGSQWSSFTPMCLHHECPYNTGGLHLLNVGKIHWKRTLTCAASRTVTFVSIITDTYIWSRGIVTHGVFFAGVGPIRRAFICICSVKSYNVYYLAKNQAEIIQVMSRYHSKERILYCFHIPEDQMNVSSVVHAIGLST